MKTDADVGSVTFLVADAELPAPCYAARDDDEYLTDTSARKWNDEPASASPATEACA